MVVNNADHVKSGKTFIARKFHSKKESKKKKKKSNSRRRRRRRRNGIGK